jgi:hypothetical protein
MACQKSIAKAIWPYLYRDKSLLMAHVRVPSSFNAAESNYLKLEAGKLEWACFHS